MTSPMSPLGGVHDDERMLDQLAARSYAGDDELGQALNAWARRVDVEAQAAVGRTDIDELIRRHAVPVVAEEPTKIRIRASRLIATLGGVGVAAAALGIALVNGYNVPGLPALTPSHSSTSVVIDQQLLAEARQITEEVKSGVKPKQEALIQIAELRAQATDPVVKEKLQSIQVEVLAAPVSPNAPSAASSTTSPSSLPKIMVPAPDVMTTPTPKTEPVAPEKPATSEKPTSVSPTDPTSIPSATSTPGPDHTSTSPSSSSSTSPTSKSTSRTVTIPGRPKTTASAGHSAPAQVPASSGGTTHDVVTSGAGSVEPDGSSPQPSAPEPTDP